MISQQRYKYSQCVSEHENPWNHKYIKFQGRTHKGMCCFLCKLQQALPVKFCTPCHHTSTRFSASISICNIRPCSYVGIKVNNHTSLCFAKITFFFSKKGKIWGCVPIINTKKKEKKRYIMFMSKLSGK